jgi:putative transcriptional regulator
MRDSLTAKLLVATPTIGDPRFSCSVIYVCSHTEDHAMGIIVNKALGRLTLPDLLDQIGIQSSIIAPPRPVLRGGPVDRERGFVLHSDDYSARHATHAIAPGISLTATKEVLEAIVSETPPHQAVLALGYASWGPGQLEGEILENAWMIADAEPDMIFDLDLETKWDRAMRSIGVDPARLTHQSGRA